MAPVIFGPLDVVLAPVVEYVVLVLVLVNLVTRLLAHRTHRRQAEAGPEAVRRHRLHELSNGLLVLGTFYFLSLHHHAGIVLSMLVLGTIVADFFEFEARLVEARNDLPIEAPKGAIAGSVLVLAYSGYLAALPAGPIGQFLVVFPLA